MAKKRTPFTFSHITERDVDLLLVEELNCSEEFQRFFLNEVGDRMARRPWDSVESVSAMHSVRTPGEGSGETDIEISFECTGAKSRQRVLLIIENKIDADVQSRQGERYQERCEVLVSEGRCDRAHCALLAPALYLQSKPDFVACFDAHLPYEGILEGQFKPRLQSAGGELAARLRLKIEMMEQAISGARRKYRKIVTKEGTVFCRQYHKLAAQVAPELQMRDPGSRGAKGSWISFDKALRSVRGLPAAKILHKYGGGRVDLQISHWGDHIDLLEPILSGGFEHDMRVVQATKSLSIAIDVPPLDDRGSFQEQRELVERGLKAAQRLKRWYEDNSEFLLACAKIVELSRASARETN